jgi:cell fate (sporulation/competence/biofilm development) regulator YmcA (YheA/YmcA/DUF963 family)
MWLLQGTELDYAKFEHRFWLHILADHARFIFDTLVPSQIDDLQKAEVFRQQYDDLYAKADVLTEKNAIAFAIRVEDVTKQFREFKLSLIARHLIGEMIIHLTPTFLNHMVNELDEYVRIIQYLKQGEKPPLFHELHHHLIWLLDASGHAGAINDHLDGVEKRLKEKSAQFTQHFDQFYLKAVELTGYLRTNIDQFPSLERFNHDVEIEMKLFQTFLHEIEEMELNAEVLSTFTASMADHMAREEQYYLLKLAEVRNS